MTFCMGVLIKIESLDLINIRGEGFVSVCIRPPPPYRMKNEAIEQRNYVDRQLQV